MASVFKYITENAAAHGYGQIEPNHLSAQRTGQIYAQLPIDETAFPNGIENGQFAKYNYAEGKVNLGENGGEWMLVFNEVKPYGDRETDADFILTKNHGATPRLFKTNVGDIYTTNAIGETAVAEKDVLKINAQGILAKDGTSDIEFQVAKVYTMPDGQPGVKLVRIA